MARTRILSPPSLTPESAYPVGLRVPMQNMGDPRATTIVYCLLILHLREDEIGRKRPEAQEASFEEATSLCGSLAQHFLRKPPKP